MKRLQIQGLYNPLYQSRFDSHQNIPSARPNTKQKTSSSVQLEVAFSSIVKMPIVKKAT